MKDRKEAPIKLNLDISSDENDFADQGVIKLKKRKGVSIDVLNFKTADSVERRNYNRRRIDITEWFCRL